MSSKIQIHINHIARIFYHSDPDKFEAAMREGKFDIVSSLKVIKVKDLNVSLSLSGISKDAKIDSIYESGRIILSEDAIPEEDFCAVEVCDIVGINNPDTISQIARILLSKDILHADKTLKLYGIQDLPANISSALDGLLDESFSALPNFDLELGAAFNVETKLPSNLTLQPSDVNYDDNFINKSSKDIL